MIDWNKPIETVDGRKVNVCRAVISRSGEGAKVIYVSPPPGAVFGDVFLVDEQGFRCDDSAPEEPMQIIRNLRVKREGWVVARASIGAAPIIERTRLYATQEEAQAGCVWEKSFPMFVTWEE